MENIYTTLISPHDFLEICQSEDTVIIDVRFYLNEVSKGRKEFLEAHIPGAIYLDLNHELSSPVIKGITGRHPLPDPILLESTFRNAGISNHSQVVFYDQSNGAYASRGWWLMRWLGHEKVAVLDGGFKTWIQKDQSVDNQWLLPKAGNFTMQLRPEIVINMKEIDNLQTPLIDSREYIRYSGAHEPIDPVAGHIPGAVCIPYMDNNDENGMWKSSSALKERFSDLSLKVDEEPVFYCGSGVTACHNILAYKIATGKDARLYAGSWSEWINYHPKKNQ